MSDGVRRFTPRAATAIVVVALLVGCSPAPPDTGVHEIFPIEPAQFSGSEGQAARVALAFTHAATQSRSFALAPCPTASATHQEARETAFESFRVSRGAPPPYVSSATGAESNGRTAQVTVQIIDGSGAIHRGEIGVDLATMTVTAAHLTAAPPSLRK